MLTGTSAKMVRNNNIIHNVHFHKQWQRKIKCHFDQPAKKKKRCERRKKKAEHIAPRPLKKLRPVVRCPTARYNIKQRLGRGFTADELKVCICIIKRNFLKQLFHLMQ